MKYIIILLALLIASTSITAKNYYSLSSGIEINRTTKGQFNAGDEFTAFNFKFRMPTTGIRSLEIMSSDGTTHSATGRFVCIDSGGVHAGSSSVSITTTWKRLCDRNFTQIGDRESGTFVYNGDFFRLTFIIGPSYNNNRIVIEKI